MFGLFKKEEPKKPIDPHAREMVEIAATMLQMQLSLCSSSLTDESFDTDFFRGYLFGFFDAAIQTSGVDRDNAVEFDALILLGHFYLIGAKPERIGSYVLESRSRTKNRAFQAAQLQGGNEYVDFVRENRQALGLSQFILGE
jgi:hypothetical protein